jgi:hypothetical protein
MMATYRRTVITAGGETAGTIVPGVQVLQVTGLAGHKVNEYQPQTTSLLSRRSNLVPKLALRGPSKVTVRGLNAGKNRPFDPRSSRLRCKSIFSQKSVPFPRSFNRSNKATLPIHCSV